MSKGTHSDGKEMLWRLSFYDFGDEAGQKNVITQKDLSGQ
jgi:hypothetical protein